MPGVLVVTGAVSLALIVGAAATLLGQRWLIHKAIGGLKW